MIKKKKKTDAHCGSFLCEIVYYTQMEIDLDSSNHTDIY
jgi:hypothetical protein